MTINTYSLNESNGKSGIVWSKAWQSFSSTKSPCSSWLNTLNSITKESLADRLVKRWVPQMRLPSIALISVPGFHGESPACGQPALLPALVGVKRTRGSIPLSVTTSQQSTHRKWGYLNRGLPKSGTGNCISVPDLFFLIFRRRVCGRGNG